MEPGTRLVLHRLPKNERKMRQTPADTQTLPMTGSHMLLAHAPHTLSHS